MPSPFSEKNQKRTDTHKLFNISIANLSTVDLGRKVRSALRENRDLFQKSINQLPEAPNILSKILEEFKFKEEEHFNE